MLAGLYEFPTVPNVSVPPTPAALRDAPRALLATLLVHPLAVKDGDIGLLHIERTAPAGDVVHVFSHIRKTYRVQWIVLQGGGPECPALAHQIPARGVTRPSTSSTAAAAAEAVEAAAIAPREATTAASSPSSAIWTPIDSVVDAKYVSLPFLSLGSQVCAIDRVLFSPSCFFLLFFFSLLPL